MRLQFPHILSLGFLWFLSHVCQAQTTSFAIVIDEVHYKALTTEIGAYREELEKDGLQVHVLSREWLDPGEIRGELQQLYKNQHLEGAVFIGDIPIPMIRDAQHLTSTFKMPQHLDWVDSSVPSDRFYDDFDLQLEFIRKDPEHTNLFYYRLLPHSTHEVQMDIYSGRIKAPTDIFEESIEYIKTYLKKLVVEKRRSNPLNQIVTYSGQGYSSDALNSWGSLLISYRTQFAELFSSPNQIKFMNYRNSENMKPILLDQLQRNDLDYAYLNGHGLPSEQILSGNPDVSNPKPSMQNVARYVRSQMRRAKDRDEDLDEETKELQERLGLNDKWFQGIFSQESIQKDSLYNAQQVIHIEDLKNNQINARIAYLDACETGSFQRNDFLAAHYPFNKGKNIVSIANSVGVLQDLWAHEYIGLLQYGTRIGQILKHTAYLETHIFGDPTFHFSHENAQKWNLQLAHNSNLAFWKDQLAISQADLQAMALKQITGLEDRDRSISMLKDAFYKSPYEPVRLEAFLLLKQLRPDDWQNVVIDASDDSFEYLRRISIYEMGEMGDSVFIEPMLDLYLNDPQSRRTVFNIEQRLIFFEKQLVLRSIDKVIKEHPLHSTTLIDQLRNQIERESFFDEAFKNLNLPETTAKDAKFAISIMRAYRFHQYVPQVVTFIQANLQHEELVVPALEALSWFPKSRKKSIIIDLCQRLMENTGLSEKITYEAKRTHAIINNVR
nr:HEAT repeat domain-containing protein [uncultured Allomuricauda sp.]